MPNKIIRLTVALLAFLIGAAGVWVSGVYPKIESYLIERLSPSLELDPESKFILQASFSGTAASSQIYLIFTTGGMLERSGEAFPTPLAANQALQRKVNSASEIIERTPVLDEEGRQVGERVVALYSSGASILWTYNTVLASINAPTVQLALEFEGAFERE